MFDGVACKAVLDVLSAPIQTVPLPLDPRAAQKPRNVKVVEVSAFQPLRR